MREAPAGTAIARQSVSAMRFSTWPLLAVIVIASSGCGSDMAPVNGTVERDGRVVPGGNVIFRPIGAGKLATGVIQSDGSFQLTTNRLNDGAVVGQYRVTIAGERDSTNEDTRTTFVGPADLTLDVVAGTTNEFKIHVRTQDGWQAIKSDCVDRCPRRPRMWQRFGPTARFAARRFCWLAWMSPSRSDRSCTSA